MNKLAEIIRSLKSHAIIAVMSWILLSCGSVVSSVGTGSLAGISGTGIVFGVITGFGSIFVNGVEYEIDNNTAFDVNGNTLANQQNLAIGMAVKLKVTEDSKGTPIATSVIYDEDIKGAITSVPQLDASNAHLKSFNVLGEQVIVNDISTNFEGFDFNTLQLHDLVEVSGLRDANDAIVATRIAKQGTFTAGVSEVEIHGAISNLSNSSFMLGAITVHYDNSVELEHITTPFLNGISVEVNGILQANGSVTASKIQGEDGNDEDIKTQGNELSLQGYVSALNGSDGFVLNGFTIKIDPAKISAALFSQVQVGVEVDVKGVYDNNQLVITELNLRDANASVKGKIIDIDATNKQIQIGFNGVAQTITVSLNNNTKLEDDSSAHIEHLLLAGLNSGDPIETEINVSNSLNTLIALKRVNNIEEYEIKGSLEAKDAINKTVTVFGIVFDIDNSVSTSDIADFYSKATVGDKVELKDSDKNGTLDELSVED